MQDPGAYMMSVIAAAILCGLVRKITGDDKWTQGILKTVTGIVLAAVILKPVAGGFRWNPGAVLDRLEAQVVQAVAQGKSMRQEALAQDISQRTQAYILDKAESLGAELEVWVTVSLEELPVPVSVRLEGNVSQQVRYLITCFLTEELGIPEEEQQWTSIT